MNKWAILLKRFFSKDVMTWGRTNCNGMTPPRLLLSMPWSHLDRKGSWQRTTVFCPDHILETRIFSWPILGLNAILKPLMAPDTFLKWFLLQEPSQRRIRRSSSSVFSGMPTLPTVNGFFSWWLAILIPVWKKGLWSWFWKLKKCKIYISLSVCQIFLKTMGYNW